MTKQNVDFWVSYNKADEKWATWIAWKLEHAGFTVLIQAWDFQPGANFVLEMQEAASSAKRTIAVFSPSYLKANFTQPEWAAAFAQDPRGDDKALIPVVVEACETEGLLSQIVHINLVGLDSDAAEQKLLAGLRPGRAKPLTPPSFPGTPTSTSPETKNISQSTPQWSPLSGSLSIVWRSELPGVRKEGGAAALEMHLIPVDQQHLEVRQLGNLQTQLTGLGRDRGLFGATDGVDTYSGSDLVFCQTKEDINNSGSGLLVTRSGQRGVWFTLPRDSLGSVLDLADVQPRLESLLSLLLSIPISNAPRYAVALRVFPCIMLNVGSASVVGVRQSATMPFAANYQEPIEVKPDDSVETISLSTSSTDVTEELVARLQAALSR